MQIVKRAFVKFVLLEPRDLLISPFTCNISIKNIKTFARIIDIISAVMLKIINKK